MFAVVSAVKKVFLYQACPQKQIALNSFQRPLSNQLFGHLSATKVSFAFINKFALTVTLNVRREKMDVSEVGSADGG